MTAPELTTPQWSESEFAVELSMMEILLSEAAGTAMLTLLGCGVVANAILPKNKGYDAGWVLITFGWGFAVFAGVFTAYKTGAHINPAVTLGLVVNGSDLADGIPATAGNVATYLAGQMIGAFLGAVVMFLAYKRHFDQEAPGAVKLGVFSTGPEVRSYGWNLATEIVGTFVLVFVVIMFGNTPNELGPLAVALLVVGIGMSLGGPTGYAINPARDLGPRIAHAVLPIKGKGSSDWGYAWVPVVGPLIGGALGGLAALGL